MSDISRQDSHPNRDPSPQAAHDDRGADATPTVLVDDQAHDHEKAGSPPDSKKNREDEILDRVKTGERWMIVLTAAVACVSIFQAVETYCNNVSTGKQVDKIITATNGVNQAANSFSKSASGINDGLANAVEKLGLQYQASKDFSGLTSEQFSKEQRPYVWHLAAANYHRQTDGTTKYHTGANIYWVNYGHSPALNFSSVGKVFCGENALRDAYAFFNHPPPWGTQDLVIAPTVPDATSTPPPYDGFVGDDMSQQNVILCETVQPRVIVGIMEYSDNSGRRYRGEFCTGDRYFEIQGYPASGNCHKHNKM